MLRDTLLSAAVVAAILLAPPLAAQAAPPLAAQTPPPRAQPWRAYVGLTLGNAFDTEGGSAFAVVGAFTVERGGHAGTFRLAVLSDLRGFPDSGGGDEISEVGLLYGRTRTRGTLRTRVAAGLSAVHFSVCPGSDPRHGCSRPGVPLVADATLTSPVVGIGLQAYGNLNTEASWVGLGLRLAVGWMPRR